MDTNRKILLIGLDGGTWTVLKPAMEQGYMPFLKSLADRGASGILESTVPAITPAAWGGFQTGKKPGKTGVFDFAYWDKENKKSQYVSSIDLGERIWEILSRNEKRIAAINVPMTYPPAPVNGHLISGLLTPSLESDFTWPKELKKQLLEQFPSYHIFNLKKISKLRSDDAHLTAFIEQLRSIIKNRTEVALWMLNKEPLDVFMVHFQATDVLQHVYWHFMDRTHPLFDSSKQAFILKEFYQLLDQKIRSVYETFTTMNGEPLTVILSDHGFQSHFKRFNLGNWLSKEGYLKSYKHRAGHKTPILKKITRTLRIGKILKYLIPPSSIGNIDKKYVSRSEKVRWPGSIAYSVGRSNEGFIYLLPEDEAEKTALANEIREKILLLRDPETESGLAQKVWLKDEIYHGEQTDRLPDIIVEPANGYSFTGYIQPGEDLFHTVTLQEDMHIGKHHRDGIFVATGENVTVSTAPNASITDIVPTLLYYLGLPIPDDIDGQPLTGLFSESFKKQNPVKSQIKKDTIHQSKKNDYSIEDQKNIEKRLQDLGYL